MSYRLFQVDAFADCPFEGNPAAVMPLDAWLTDDVLQRIAAENNLSETAYFVPESDGYRLRWFTPTVEVPLCGHATLASAHVLFTHLKPDARAVRFHTQSGALDVTRDGDGLIVMNFPSNAPAPCEAPDGLVKSFNKLPQSVLKSTQLLCVYGTEDEVRTLQPDFAALAALDVLVIATAPAKARSGFDFVSRVFAPAHGIDEDPVTGAAHCTLTPYWAKRLGKTDLVARQVSSRGGTVHCVDAGARTILKGRCADYLTGLVTL